MKSFQNLATIRKPAEMAGKVVRFSNGQGHYGHVVILLEPFERGSGYQFVNKSRNSIPEKFILAVERGCHKALKQGVRQKYPVVDVRCTLLDGSWHDIDSHEEDFEGSSAIAVQKAIKKAGTILLFPIVKFKIRVQSQKLESMIKILKQYQTDIKEVKDASRIALITGLILNAQLVCFQEEMLKIKNKNLDMDLTLDHYEEIDDV